MENMNLTIRLSSKSSVPPQVVREAIKKKKNIETKSSAVDLVTESDKAVEKLLIDSLAQTFPDHKLVQLFCCLYHYWKGLNYIFQEQGNQSIFPCLLYSIPVIFSPDYKVQ